VTNPIFSDLEIRILPLANSAYPVEITFHGEQEFPRGLLDPATQPPIDRARPQQTGEALFQWLFASPALQNAWAQARGRQSLRRVRLRIDAEATALHAIPWEMLRDPGLNTPPVDLACADATPFSRYLAGPWVPGSPILKRPIRVLAAIAAQPDLEDKGLDPIDAAAEFDLLQKVFAGNPDIELVPSPKPCTRAALAAALRTGIHVLHLVAHGHFQNGTAILYLADDDNNTIAVDDTALATDLACQLGDSAAASEDKLRLAFLSCCKSATRSPADAFRGLAPKLVAAGLPAVLAMQDNVPVETAHAFGQTFYRELVTHGQVDLASNVARASLACSNLRGAAIPALFMRLRSGQLLGNPGKILGSFPETSWRTLVDNIRRKDCTPILGSGVTSGILPQPEEISRQLATNCGFPFSDPANFLRVSQVIGTIDDTSLRQQVIEIMSAGFRKRAGLPPTEDGLTLSETIAGADWINLGPRLFETEAHRQLADFALPLYVTTNFDNLMALALEARLKKPARRETLCWQSPPADRPEFDRPPAPADPIVLHLFGTDGDLQSMVLTEDDHLDYLTNVSANEATYLPSVVQAELASTTLLFIGFRLEELGLKVILRGLVKRLDLAQHNRLQLAVQLEASQPDEASEKEVVDYLQRALRQYFPAKATVQIYWGTAQQFLADLSARWKRVSK